MNQDSRLSQCIRLGARTFGPSRDYYFVLSPYDDRLLANVWGCAYVGLAMILGTVSLSDPRGYTTVRPSDIRQVLFAHFPELDLETPSVMRARTGERNPRLFDYLDSLYLNGWPSGKLADLLLPAGL